MPKIVSQYVETLRSCAVHATPIGQVATTIYICSRVARVEWIGRRDRSNCSINVSPRLEKREGHNMISYRILVDYSWRNCSSHTKLISRDHRERWAGIQLIHLWVSVYLYSWNISRKYLWYKSIMKWCSITLDLVASVFSSPLYPLSPSLRGVYYPVMDHSVDILVRSTVTIHHVISIISWWRCSCDWSITRCSVVRTAKWNMNLPTKGYLLMTQFLQWWTCLTHRIRMLNWCMRARNRSRSNHEKRAGETLTRRIWVTFANLIFFWIVLLNAVPYRVIPICKYGESSFRVWHEHWIEDRVVSIMTISLQGSPPLWVLSRSGRTSLPCCSTMRFPSHAEGRNREVRGGGREAYGHSLNRIAK